MTAQQAHRNVRRGRRRDPDGMDRAAQVRRLVDDGASVSEACRSVGVAPASYYRWRNAAAEGVAGGDDSRGPIIAAAKVAFAAEGMAVSLARVAQAAGVSRQTVYNLYGSKKALLADVLRDIYAAFMILEHDPDDGDDLADVLNLFGGRFLRMAVDDNALMANRLTIAQYGKDPEISRLIFDLADRNSLGGLTSRLAGYLARRQQDGQVRPGDPLLLAETFRSAVMGTIRLQALAGVAQSSAARDAHLACAVAIFMRGLPPPAGPR